jgi:hypothetical protein
MTPLASVGLTALGDLAHGVESLTGLLARNHTLVIDLVGAYLGFKAITGLTALVASGLETMALRALYARDAIVAMTTTEDLANFGALATTGERVGAAFFGIGRAALTTLGPMALVAAAALVAVNGIQGFIKGEQDAKKFTDDLNLTLTKTPDSINAYNTALGQVQAKIDKLSASVGGGDFWHKFLGGFTGATEQVLVEMPKLDKLQTNLQNQRASLNALIDSIASANTHAGGPSFMDELAIATAASNAGVLSLDSSLSDNIRHVADWKKGTLDATPAQSAINQVLKDGANAATSAAQAASDLQKAIDALGTANQNFLGTQLDVNKDILTLYQNVAVGTRTLDQNSLAGIQNNQAILTVTGAIEQHVKAMTAQNASQEQVNAYVYSSSVALENQLVHLGFNKKGVDALIQSLLQMPPSKSTNVTVPGAAAADNTVRNLNRDLDNMPDHRTVTLDAVDHASSTLSAIRNMIANINPNIPLTVTGYANLSKLTGFSSANGNIFSAYAAGGYEHHVAQIAPAGAMRLWAEPETGGEAYIPLAPSKRSRSVDIWAQTGRALGVYAQGGYSGSYNGTPSAGNSRAGTDDQLLDALEAIRAEIRKARPITVDNTFVGVDPAVAQHDANRQLAYALRGT